MTAPQRRILFPYTGDSIGGSHVSSLLLATHLDPAQYMPVVGLHDDGPLDAYLQDLGLEADRLPRVSYPKPKSLIGQWHKFIQPTLRLTRFLRAQRIDIVHTNDLRMHLAWSLPARLAGVGHVWHQRTPSRNRSLNLYCRTATRILTVSEYCRAQLPDRMRQRAKVVYNPFTRMEGLAHDDARAALLQAIARPETRQIVGFVGNFAERKRPEFFVSLAAAVAPRLAGAAFVMVGEARPPHDRTVRAAIEAAGLRERVHLLGPRFPIEPWLAGMDLLIAPARQEAFGRTLVEAMLAGTPVLAAAEAGHLEIIEPDRTGLLAAPDDLDDFAAKLLATFDRPEDTRARRDAALQEAQRRFSLDTHLRAIQATYDALPRAAHT